ncbi:methyl-accepting chemotaxis protein [Leptolyngbya sp. Heron Island J]|uniref:methyl-accepting chemotaxis protein n=1 Tax=Leptolyngbya sp. Heron Island J TaxID=1385935 RepID=UPI0003B94292|nr:methyl-accepting chemotaxis protein [Leptolyngbya sp. Heron Island J]ESA33857.1 methyl-accepting chemotaxis protein [Leptolyngbya sp. Heron Island J]
MRSFKLPTSKQSITPFKNLPNTPQSYQPTLIDRAKGWFRLNSFGGRLFWMIMLGAVAGMGGMAFLFSEMLKRQAEEQVLSNIDSKVNAIASVTDSAETLAYSLGVSATTLHERGAQFPDTYRELVLQLFERRPEFVVGLGLGQSENGIIKEQPWLFPYYSAINSSEDTTVDPGAIRYEDFADNAGEFYPKSERYRNYFEPQTSLWTAPYQGEKQRLLTYYYPLFNSDGRWLGTSLVDIDSGHLGNLLNDAVFQQAGHFLLLTQSGQVITNPSDPAIADQTYQNIAGLEPIWQQVNVEAPGFLKGDSGYWAYATVPGQDWLLFGFVPHQAIYGRIVRIATITTGLMILLLGTVVFLAIRKLNQRIKPILLQGKQFVNTDGNLLAEVAITQKDELEQLSLSFFNILDQLNQHQETIRRQAETIDKSNLHADQVTEKFLAFAAQLDDDTCKQRVMIQKVRQQLAEQANKYQSVDSRLDGLFTLAQTLGGYLESMPSATESVQMFDTLHRHLLTLTQAVDQATQSTDKSQFQALIAQLIADMANLKAYERQRHSLEKLHHQTTDITQSRQATMANSQAMVAAAQTITQILAEIETITTTLGKDANQASDMLWGDLQRGQLTISKDTQAHTLDLLARLPQTHTSMDAPQNKHLHTIDEPWLGETVSSKAAQKGTP